MTKLTKSLCPRCNKLVVSENMTRHIFNMHISGKRAAMSEEHLNAVINGRKNTTPCIKHQRKRSTLLSLDGGQFKPFSGVLIGDMNKSREIRACGEEFSLYQEHRTWSNRKKIVWVDQEEHGNPTYVPNNMIDRAIADGIDL